MSRTPDATTPWAARLLALRAANPERRQLTLTGNSSGVFALPTTSAARLRQPWPQPPGLSTSGEHVWFSLRDEGADTNALIWNFLSSDDLSGLRPAAEARRLPVPCSAAGAAALWLATLSGLAEELAEVGVDSRSDLLGDAACLCQSGG